MNTSYIFTGIGYSLAEHKISNNEILQHIHNGHLSGFDEYRIKNSDEFIQSKDQNLSPFCWMTEKLMGFKNRYHVVPFPPALNKYKTAESTVDLCVKAVENALQKANISGKDIDAWFIGTATAPQPAPGIAEMVKAYFTDYDNNTPTYSLTSACVGFNINLQNAIAYFKSNPNANHIVIAHTEIMSRLLLNETDFVPFATFGDSASAVILSKIQTENICGVNNIENHEDTQMLDFLGADKNGNLYMDARRVKSRAVPNISNTIKSLLAKNNWTIEDIKTLIPHQTGNAIVHSVAEKTKFPLNKVYQDVQLNFGNLSGSSVPVSLAELIYNKQILPGDKIITAVAGLGGEYGGFSYIVPENIPVNNTRNNDLENRTAFITGATGGLGKLIAEHFAKRKANLILHYNSNHKAAEDLKNNLETKYNVTAHIYKANFKNKEEINNMCQNIIHQHNSIDYIINNQAITGSLSRASEIDINELEEVLQVNYSATKQVCENLESILKSCIIFIGSVGEDAQFPGSAAYVASKRALRGFARDFAKKVYDKNIRCIYYLPGIIDGGMADKLDKNQKNASMMMAGQKDIIPVKAIAERIVKSVYIPKVLKVRNSFEGVLIVRKDGYSNF